MLSASDIIDSFLPCSSAFAHRSLIHRYSACTAIASQRGLPPIDECFERAASTLARVLQVLFLRAQPDSVCLSHCLWLSLCPCLYPDSVAICIPSSAQCHPQVPTLT